MSRINLSGVADQLSASGVTHVVWVPDSELGALESYLSPDIHLVRACREGEAVAIAAGLMIAGARPVVICQCTGFFEAGDAFRNVVKDLQLPLFLLIGHRNRTAYALRQSHDSAAKCLEPILRAWGVEYQVLEPDGDPSIICAAYNLTRQTGAARAVVIAE